MFGVKNDFFAVRRKKFHALADHGKILFGSRFDDVCHVADMAFSENGDVFGIGGEQGFQIAVFCRRNAFATGGTECNDLGVGKFHALDPLEKLHFGGIGKRIARFNEIDAQPVERLDDFDFIVDGKRDVGTLCAVAQGRVEYL